MSEPAVVVDGLVMRYGDKVAVDGLSLTVERGTITAVLGPNGAGKTTTLETCEGYRAPAAGHGPGARARPACAQRRDLLPRIGVMLQDGGAWSGVRAMEMLDHIARLHAHPLDTDDARASGSAWASAAGRRTAGSPAASSSGSAWRWRSSGGPRSSSSTSRPPGMDPQARRDDLGAARGAARRRRDRGADHALHGRGRAARRPDPHHRPRPADRQRARRSSSPAAAPSATIRLVVTKPFPPGAPESLRRALGDRTEVTQLDELSLLVTGPADASTLAKVSRWCEEHDVLPESLTLGPAHPRGRLPAS